jgi:hypothetical protein
MAIKKIVTTRYIDDEGFEYAFEPISDTLKIISGGRGKKKIYKAGYLVQDKSPTSPDEDGDDNLFLVHYHRDFEVRRDDIITKNDAVNWYRKTFEDYEDENGKVPENIPQTENYWIFPVAAYIHSGVYLYIPGHKPSNVYLQHDSWDTSHVGLVLVAKSEWPKENNALEAAKGHLEYWNQYLSGDVYGIVVEKYNADKEQVEEDSCWGYFGFENAKEEMEATLKYF